jgi:hypothetical protein
MHFDHFPKDLMSFHVWRQTQTQSNIINFYEEDMNILNPRRNARGDGDGIFRMEFPLMQWMVAILYKIFGNHLIITRIFMFIIGVFSVLGIYKLLFELFRNDWISLIGAWAFNFSPSFYYYTINPLPDNLALCFSIWGMALFFTWLNNEQMKFLVFSSILLSLGALCKLPFILYFIVPLTHFILESRKHGVSRKILIRAIASFGFAIFPFAWYIYVVPDWHGNGITTGMLDNNISFSTLLYYLEHNLISTMPELLINYGSLLFFLAGFIFFLKNKAWSSSKFPLLLSWSIIIWLYFIFELNMIADDHDYYLFPFYPLLFIVISYGAYHLYQMNLTFFKYFTIFLIVILPFTCLLRMQIRWNPDKPGFNKDLLIYKTELREAVPKESLVVAGNDRSKYIYFYYIDKKGWSFHADNLSSEKIKTMIQNGAEYLYSDSRHIDQNAEIKPLLEKMILQKGSVRVYKLKDINQLSQNQGKQP